jgi:DNA-binding transcriptional ArsR family regulator
VKTTTSRRRPQISHDPDALDRVRCDVIESDDAADVAETFRVLADPTRVTILHALCIDDLCNNDLAELLGISPSAVSHQMRELKLLKLVESRKDGRMVVYRIADTHVRHVLQDTLRHVAEGTT